MNVEQRAVLREQVIGEYFRAGALSDTGRLGL